ncbi:tetratricopeptide repeat protein [Caballeronia sp. LZ062]|uniref:tetratricopeptide repeat protein n=1 Tax=unclassified Caballeronia TaxID=2646786 RepID=UPI0028655B4A|nr:MULTISPECIES: tetratricopeptide repeat protein [unclassified Caballeronia]MDR5854395.1 tetratricopeptide repeat protein [Caballeronia sp. LZ050]MDR5871074.1 tetratricopeptide repeat protein [Caballeronia sp. LZ062]
MKKTLTALALSISLALSVASPLALAAVPTAQQVEQSMTQGNWQKADAQLSEVLGAHPDNAHAHYLYAQVLDREGRYSDALSHLQQAKSLDPSLGFTDASRFASTEARIRSDANRTNATTNRGSNGSVALNPFNQGQAAAPQKHGPSMGMWIGLAVLIAAIALVLRWGLRRARARDDGRSEDDRRAQLKRATELLNDVRTLKLDVRLSTAPGHEALLRDVEGTETQLREMVEALSNAKNPVPPYAIEDLENQVASIRARAEGRPDPAAANAGAQGQSPFAQEAERFGRDQQPHGQQAPYPQQGPYPQGPYPQQGQQPPVIIQQGGGGFGGGMGGLLTGVLLGEAMSHGRDRVIEREVPVERRDAGNDNGGLDFGNSNGGGLDFGNGSNDWDDGSGSGGGLDLGSNDDNWRDT